MGEYAFHTYKVKTISEEEKAVLDKKINSFMLANVGEDCLVDIKFVVSGNYYVHIIYKEGMTK